MLGMKPAAWPTTARATAAFIVAPIFRYSELSKTFECFLADSFLENVEEGGNNMIEQGGGLTNSLVQIISEK